MSYLLFLILLFGSNLKGEAKEDTLSKGERKRVLRVGQDYGTDKGTLELPASWHTDFIKRDTIWLKVGGAFRLNNVYAHYEGQTFPLGTFLRNEWTWDTWRLNVDAYSEGIQLSFEYRFYPTFNTHFLKYGWLGYRFNEKTNFKMGVTQVPFGIQSSLDNRRFRRKCIGYRKRVRFQTAYIGSQSHRFRSGLEHTIEHKYWLLFLKKSLYEIEHDAGDARRDDYNCEILCDL